MNRRSLFARCFGALVAFLFPYREEAQKHLSGFTYEFTSQVFEVGPEAKPIVFSDLRDYARPSLSVKAGWMTVTDARPKFPPWDTSDEGYLRPANIIAVKDVC